MTPGDAVTCSACGAYGRVWCTGAQHVDGWPVLVTWATPDGERTMLEPTGAAARPLECRACGCTDPRAVVIHRRGPGGAFVNATPAPVNPAPVSVNTPPARGQLSLL